LLVQFNKEVDEMNEDERHERMAEIEDRLGEIEREMNSITESAGYYYSLGEWRVNGYDNEERLDDLESEASDLRGELVALDIDPHLIEGCC
jgi:hypothetical protein